MLYNVKQEQSESIKFCFKIRKNTTKTFLLLKKKKLRGNERLSRSQVFEQFGRLRDGIKKV